MDELIPIGQFPGHIAQHLDDAEASDMTDTSATDRQAVTLERAIPILASTDLEATQRFYADKLGFQPVSTYPDYAVCTRDGVQVHFWLTDDADIARATSCRIHVIGIRALYAEMTAAGVVHPNGPLRNQPWGFTEFAVLDGDGNLITFGERTP